ncbi:hypothetical protein LUZ60_001969 [Juncus effusus]|nr:hypothetical protein LUZ60_001969 [Juncus effusus]
MVGDFIVCVDRIIASACLAGGGDAGGVAAGAEAVVVEGNKGKNCGEKKRNSGGKSWSKDAIECRICQEEGEEGDMESPCACSGTLKFAHRKCIQKWCNKKGNITCEICNQVYSPNYSIPPVRTTCSDMIAIDIRQSWLPQMDHRDSHFLALTVAEQELLEAEYQNYASFSSNSVACCRLIAFILMLLLIVRQMLLISRDISALQDVSVLFNASLQFAGFFLPCYVIARSCYLIHNRRRRMA